MKLICENDVKFEVMLNLIENLSNHVWRNKNEIIFLKQAYTAS